MHSYMSSSKNLRYILLILNFLLWFFFRRSLARQRKRQLPVVTSQDDLSSIPKEFTVDSKNCPFLIFNGVNDFGGRILIFASKTGLQLMKSSLFWAVDGTFDKTSSLFYQVYPGRNVFLFEKLTNEYYFSVLCCWEKFFAGLFFLVAR